MDLSPEAVLDLRRFQDTWDDAHMDMVVEYLAKDTCVALPDEWRDHVFRAICSCLIIGALRKSSFYGGTNHFGTRNFGSCTFWGRNGSAKNMQAVP